MTGKKKVAFTFGVGINKLSNGWFIDHALSKAKENGWDVFSSLPKNIKYIESKGICVHGKEDIIKLIDEEEKIFDMGYNKDEYKGYDELIIYNCLNDVSYKCIRQAIDAEDTMQIKGFLQVGGLKSKISLVRLIKNNPKIKVKHVIIDFTEFNFSRLFEELSIEYEPVNPFYEDIYSKFNSKFEAEWDYSCNIKKYDSEPKDFKFTFGCVCSSYFRAWFIDTFKELFELNAYDGINVCGRLRCNMKNQIDKMVPREDYLNMLRHSKYTLVMPGSTFKGFSMMRLKEAMRSHCKPIIMIPDKKNRQASEYMDIVYDLDKKGLLGKKKLIYVEQDELIDFIKNI